MLKDLAKFLLTVSAVCGYYINPQQKKNKVISETKFFIAYERYFGMKMGDQDKSWSHIFTVKVADLH